MVIVPFFLARGNLATVHDIWYHWQSLNVGMIALTSSFVAFNISRFNENKQRERNFVAARAFLPEAFSELSDYFLSSSAIYKEAWDRIQQSKDLKVQLNNSIPKLPESYKDTFSHCIKFADPDVGNYLVNILMLLQIHNSRLQDYAKCFKEGSTSIILHGNIISHLYKMAELKALMDKIFGYSRGLQEFDSSNLVFNDFYNAYGILGIRIHDFDGLKEYTEGKIKDQSSGNTTKPVPT